MRIILRYQRILISEPYSEFFVPYLDFGSRLSLFHDKDEGEAKEELDPN
jgi:hypothetical protein